MVEINNFKKHHGTRGQAIKSFCLQCSGYAQHDVKKCTVIKCSLFPYRMGKNPKDSQLVKGINNLIKIMERD